MKKIFSDKDTLSFFISLLVAFVLWLLIKLSGEFQTEQRIGLHFTYFPIDKVLVNKPDSAVTVRINNTGFDMLGQWLFNRNKSIEIPFSRARFANNKQGIQTYYILTSGLQQNMEELYNTTEQIVSIRPDSILFKFEPLASRKVKVKPLLNLSLGPRFKQYQAMQISPDSLLIYGPPSLLDTLQFVQTEPLILNNLNKKTDTAVQVWFPNTKLHSQQQKVRILLDIQEYTEGKIKLPIYLEEIGGSRFKLFPPEATVTYQVALKDYKRINANGFLLQAIPDSTISGRLVLKLSAQPKNVIVSNIQPATAEYILLK